MVGDLFGNPMARIVKETNGNYALNGLSLQDGRPTLHKDADDDIAVTIDWSRVLGSATIASVVNTADGVTVDTEANTTTESSFNVSSRPRANSKIVIAATLSDGQVITERLNVIERDL